MSLLYMIAGKCGTENKNGYVFWNHCTGHWRCDVHQEESELQSLVVYSFPFGVVITWRWGGCGSLPTTFPHSHSHSRSFSLTRSLILTITPTLTLTLPLSCSQTYSLPISLSLPLPVSFTSRCGWRSRAPASRSGRSRNPKITGLSPEPAGLKPDRDKAMTSQLILVAS